MKRLLTLLALCASVSAQASDAIDERARALEKELRCVVCQNQTVADSNADIAIDIRKRVRAELEAGKSEAQIVDELVARYGDFVRYKPALTPMTLVLWIAPPLALLAALGWLLRRVRRNAAPAVAAKDENARRQRGRALLDDGETP